MSRAKIIIISFSVLILIIACFLVFQSFFQAQQKENKPKEVQSVSTSTQTISLSVFATIQEINGNVLTIKAEKSNNHSLTEDKIFKATITEQTDIKEVKGPISLDISRSADNQLSVKIKNLNGSDYDISKMRQLSIQDLQVGKQALFIGTENLQLNNSFVAQKIYLLSN